MFKFSLVLRSVLSLSLLLLPWQLAQAKPGLALEIQHQLPAKITAQQAFNLELKALSDLPVEALEVVFYPQADISGLPKQLMLQPNKPVQLSLVAEKNGLYYIRLHAKLLQGGSWQAKAFVIRLQVGPEVLLKTTAAKSWPVDGEGRRLKILSIE